MAVDPEGEAKARQIAVGKLIRDLSEAAGQFERASGKLRAAFASPHIDDPDVARYRERALRLLVEAGALVTLEQARAR
jgi:hypothetical protein